MHTHGQLHALYEDMITRQERPAGEDAAHGTTFPVDPADPPSPTALRARLLDLFRRRPGLRTVVLTTGEDTIGTVHRDTLRPDAPDTSRDGRGALPMYGTSGSRTLIFACAQPGCPAKEFRLYVDGEAPDCPLEAHHGPMVLER